VVDVGGEYSASARRFDHHQRGFAATFPRRSTTLSSAGLVYLHFGRSVIARLTGLAEADAAVGLLHEKLYADFVEAVDANDNGIAVYDPAAAAGLAKRFDDAGVTLASLVGDLNHATGGGGGQEAEDARFRDAAALMGAAFERKLARCHEAWLPARGAVAAAYAARFGVDDTGAVMVLEGGGVPWKEHLYGLEAEAAAAAAAATTEAAPPPPPVLYVLYPESGSGGARWRVQCVSVSRDSFESRRPLREEWRGVRDGELSGRSGIAGCVFVHASGFIGGNATRAGALEMARRSMA
jgi:uncharacterized UPF0160 family protein